MNAQNFYINKTTKHLYIHIPYCKNICTYCDFYRFIPKNIEQQNEYIENIISEINLCKNLFSTIYIGGGTPNYLNNNLLNKLLLSLQKNINKNTEFTIECNPDLVTQKQIEIFINNKINRISLGVQSLNNNILKITNRQYDKNKIFEIMNLFKKNKIKNISCDFIYNLPLMKKSDLNEIFDFIKKYKVKHISFYGLEIKENSILNKKNYKLDLDLEGEFYKKIKTFFQKENYFHYEISNWAINRKYISKHNLAYWKMNDWKAIGIGGYGFEKNVYYKIIDFNNLSKKFKFEMNMLSEKEFYQYILIMGLRLCEGINLNIKKNNLAYNFFKNKINDDIYLKNNYLIAKDIDRLNDLLEKIV